MYLKTRKILILALLVIAAVDVALQLLRTPWVWAWNALYWAVLTILNLFNFKAVLSESRTRKHLEDIHSDSRL